MGDDNTTTLIPANGSNGFFHSGGNHCDSGKDQLLSQLILSNNLADESRSSLSATYNATGFVQGAIERNHAHVRDDLRESTKQAANDASTIRKELVEGINEVKQMVLENRHYNERVVRQIENDRIRAELADVKAQLLKKS